MSFTESYGKMKRKTAKKFGGATTYQIAKLFVGWREVSILLLIASLFTLIGIRFIPNFRELGVNLLAGFVGSFVTLVGVEQIITSKEIRKWLPLHKRISDSILLHLSLVETKMLLDLGLMREDKKYNEEAKRKLIKELTTNTGKEKIKERIGRLGGVAKDISSSLWPDINRYEVYLAPEVIVMSEEIAESSGRIEVYEDILQDLGDSFEKGKPGHEELIVLKETSIKRTQEEFSKILNTIQRLRKLANTNKLGRV